MISWIALLVAVGGLMVGSVAAWRILVLARHSLDRTVFELHFPSGLDPEGVVGFVTSLTGLLRAWWQRTLGQSPAVTFEVVASAGRIRHYLVIPRSVEAFVLGQLAANLPQVAAVEGGSRPVARPALAAELALTTNLRPLSSEHPESISRALLASYLPVAAGESMVVQWTITPHPPVGPVKAPTANGASGAQGLTSPAPDSESLRAARAKQASPLFLATGRIGVVATTEQRRRALLRRLFGALHITNAPGVHFRRRLIPSTVVARRLTTRAVPIIEYPCVLNAREVVSVVAWPLGPGTPRGVEVVVRSFPPASQISTKGRVIATSTYPGQERPLALSVRDSLVHTWLCGPTGTGKSTMLANLITQDVAAGRGLVLLDPKGDLADDVLDRIPESRVGDVIHLDPSDDNWPVGLNILADAHRNPELVADQVLSIMHHLWRDYWGPRSSDTLHVALLTLARTPGTTLVDLPLLLTNDAFRRQLIGGLDDFVLQQFWSAYETMSPGERAQFIAAPMNKLRQLLVRPRLRAILGQAEPTFTIEEVIASGKILIVSLPVGVIGDEAAALTGSLITARLWQAIQGRASVKPERRPPLMVYLDEFQRFVHSATDLGETLTQARGLGAGFHLAHQHLGQLPNDLRQAVSANCRSKIVFQTAAGDAPALARELGDPVTAADLASLPAYQVVMALAAGGQVAAPVSGRTFPLPPPTGQGEAARAASRARYGRDRAEVDEAIRSRQEGPGPDGPTLRKKRSAR